MVYEEPKKMLLYGDACRVSTDPIAKASYFFDLIQVSHYSGWLAGWLLGRSATKSALGGMMAALRRHSWAVQRRLIFPLQTRARPKGLLFTQTID